MISKGEPGALGWSVPPGEGQILLQPGTPAHGWDSRWDKPGVVQTPGAGSMQCAAGKRDQTASLQQPRTGGLLYLMFSHNKQANKIVISGH